ncbi:Crp/Fnr family transcriptional regulator [Pelagibius litoralis]|uniref:Crp/Fnr family transcriptional regulator n=1 Tax=Pelagibius litoralis TaxID=374515 RepID=A0A967KC32_9PROT|nr:Crp/Fnr family transcriptional regulator [Pelagibius litoralis]NIA71442.1 Crp/Fnr family transcriptional regulator [Pelagibius litoralis]
MDSVAKHDSSQPRLKLHHGTPETLQSEVHDHLFCLMSRQEVNANQVIFFEGDPCNSIFEVAKGVVRIYKVLQDGRRQITGFLTRGDFLGLSLDDHYVYTAEGVTDVTLCRYPRDRLEKMLEENPRLSKKLFGLMNGELVSAQFQMLLLGRKTATEKLATFFVQLLQRQEGTEGSEHILNLPMPRGDIADYLGVTTETVSRTIFWMKKVNLIELNKTNQVSIEDLNGLLMLAGPFCSSRLTGTMLNREDRKGITVKG